ncbi:OmpH family outer membrane protein [Rubrolithibacter danxiaensis]|uniref:OmpH family outer membrane protein n=1 Tax=Rubrolithibacter danxiaensis TaxID=3390805 RepID=UPI003BF9147E
MNKFFANFGKLTAGFAFAAIVVSCNNKEQAKTTASSKAVVTDNKEQIVFVNSDSLLNNFSYFKDVRDKFEAKSKKAQQDLNAKGTSFQREVAEYQKNAPSMSADQRAATEERLARKQQELASFNQNASSSLASEEAAENEKLYNRVSDFLKTYAKSKGYKMVLTYSKASPTLLYADESLDVTKEVVAGLNEAYNKEKK